MPYNNSSKIDMLNRFMTKQLKLKSSKSGIYMHNFILMQERKHARSSYSHIFFFYSKRADKIIPQFQYLLFLVTNWFSISFFLLNKCTA